VSIVEVLVIGAVSWCLPVEIAAESRARNFVQALVQYCSPSQRALLAKSARIGALVLEKSRRTLGAWSASNRVELSLVTVVEGQIKHNVRTKRKERRTKKDFEEDIPRLALGCCF
jgi:hypothetical protein